ncbi:MAG TPA: class I adenylate-forming enzyme family protein [Acidimicrobiales bacterium]|nr:class I adenylate-forming enzyme family protein [Acidimicrobiales bacterium]
MSAKRPVADIDAELTAPGGPFEIEQVDIRGVPTRAWKHAPATLADILRRSRGYGERTFLVYEAEQLSFEDHFRAAARVANGLRDRFGVRRGDRVAIAMRNYPEWSEAFWGASAAGAVVVLLNAWWTAEELRYGLADSGCRVVFADAERARRIAAHRADLPDLEAVVVARAGAGDIPAGMLDWPAVVDPPGADAPGSDLPAVEVDTDDDATILYTSGTTGHPKGVLGTHRNICTNPISAQYVAARAAARAGAEPPAPGSAPPGAYLLSVPLFHATGCHSLLVGHVYNGGKMVMMHRWDPGRALELIERERITAFGGVPTMALQVLDHPDFGKRDLSSVRSVRYGGAPAPPDLARRINEQFNSSQGMNGYGMTETSALATMNAGGDYLDRPDSVGVPVPVVEAKVVDPGGRDLPPGQVGELWMKGPNVVKGYWNQPEATAETFTDGWVHTGDVARIDAEGFVYIVDRAKDMLIRGGENVYCVEVEGVLHAHPAVAEAAVIGIPHPTLGEEVGAVVTLLPGRDATQQELQHFVAARLAAFKVPVQVWFHPGGLPRNPGGKVLKRELRQQVCPSG